MLTSKRIIQVRENIDILYINILIKNHFVQKNVLLIVSIAENELISTGKEYNDMGE